MPITTTPTNPPITTANFVWGIVNQAQMGVVVSRVIQLITKPARPVVEMSLHDWAIVGGSAKQAVQHVNGAPMGFHPQRVPALGPNLFPVIICEANGTTIVLDGNHRIACHLLANSASIKAVIITEVEARSCINGSCSASPETGESRCVG